MPPPLRGIRTHDLGRGAAADISLTGTGVTITVKSSPVTGLEWPRGFQEVKVPRLHDNGTGWW